MPNSENFKNSISEFKFKFFRFKIYNIFNVGRSQNSSNDNILSNSSNNHNSSNESSDLEKELNDLIEKKIRIKAKRCYYQLKDGRTCTLIHFHIK